MILRSQNSEGKMRKYLPSVWYITNPEQVPPSEYSPPSHTEAAGGSRPRHPCPFRGRRAPHSAASQVRTGTGLTLLGRPPEWGSWGAGISQRGAGISPHLPAHERRLLNHWEFCKPGCCTSNAVYMYFLLYFFQKGTSWFTWRSRDDWKHWWKGNFFHYFVQ